MVMWSAVLVTAVFTVSNHCNSKFYVAGIIILWVLLSALASIEMVASAEDISREMNNH